MKVSIVLAIVVFFSSLAFADAQKALRNYPQWVQKECESLTETRDRVAFRNDYPAALLCAEATMDKLREDALIDSQVELNKSETEWLEESKRNLQYNRRNR